MSEIIQLLATAAELHRHGDLVQAAKIYEQILAAEPGNPDALHLLGLICRQQGDRARSTELLEKASQQLPDNALFAFDLANAWYDAHDLEKAQTALRAVIRLDPHHAPANFLLGNILRMRGDQEGAMAYYRAAIEEKPEYPEALINLASACRVAGRFGEAIVYYRKALRLRPQWPEACNALGLALSEAGYSQEALECFQRAIKLNASYSAAMMNAGRETLAQGDLAEAQHWFSRVHALEPGNAAAHSNVLLCLNYDPSCTPRRIYNEHVKWATLHASHFPAPMPFDLAPEPQRPLRIGYVSPDFYRHPVSYFIEPVLRHHDRTHFEIFCYCGVNHPDAYTARLQSLANTWRDVCGFSSEDLAGLIRNDRIDILIDLTGHCADNQLLAFARKPAPVQISYLGYPATTGLTAMDYKITDAVCNPLGKGSDYTEHLIRLTPIFCCYEPPSEAPEPEPPPARRNGFITFGSLHNLVRLNEHVLEAWAEVLRAVPSSRLLIFRTTLTDAAQRRISNLMQHCGINPTRIIFQNRMPERGYHFAVYHHIDIALDTFPWSGHTTACEALWMGVPVVTMPGTSAASRTAASVLNTVQLPQCVAHDTSGFAAICQNLARNLVELEMLRFSLRDRMRRSALMDGEGYTRRFEEEIRGMWRNWCCNQIRRTT